MRSGGCPAAVGVRQHRGVEVIDLNADKAVAERAAYVKAVEIADVLLSRGIPVIAWVPLDLGASIAMAFQLHQERATYSCRVPVGEATVERFLELYEAVR